MLQGPTEKELQEVAEQLGFVLEEKDLPRWQKMIQPSINAYNIIAKLPDFLPEVKYPRTPGRRPDPTENKYNAWYYKTHIEGSKEGKLAGRTVALKDNICLAGVPMMNGSEILEGYTPEVDATIVERILDAGGIIVGKTVCENLCFSGGSHTAATGPVVNPLKEGHSAGGSSSGSAVVVAAGEADMAIGGDQGGSIRIPSSFCGCYGMKPTWGLVPYTGIYPIEATLDHAGPITSNVKDNALLLEVIAGHDPLDPRSTPWDGEMNYTKAIGKGVEGLRIGIVTEGFKLENSNPDVNKRVLGAAEVFRKLGAIVEDVSISYHMLGPAIWTPIGLEGGLDQMYTAGYGNGQKGLYVTSMADAFSRGKKALVSEAPPTIKVSFLTAKYVQNKYQGHFYAKAQNLSRLLKAKYDEALTRFDLLLMPTLPIVSSPLPSASATTEEIIARAFEMITNTCPFDVTGHPAMSIPCGTVDGLPVGLMLIGKHYDEFTIYRAADAYSSAVDWRSL